MSDSIRYLSFISPVGLSLLTLLSYYAILRPISASARGYLPVSVSVKSVCLSVCHLRTGFLEVVGDFNEILIGDVWPWNKKRSV